MPVGFRVLVPFIVACLAAPAALALADPEAPWREVERQASMAYAEKDYASAERLIQKALDVAEKSKKPDRKMLRSLNLLLSVYYAQGKLHEAEPVFRQSLLLMMKVHGPLHPSVATGLDNYASLLRKIKRPKEALMMEHISETIRIKNQTGEFPCCDNRVCPCNRPCPCEDHERAVGAV